VYCQDVIKAILLAVLTPEALGQVINIGSGIEYKVRDVAELIVGLTHSTTRLKMGILERRPSGIQHLVCSNEKAKRLLKWSPKTSLEEGLAQTIAWFIAHQKDNTLPA